MKVLMITPYVTIISRPEFEKNKTGFGYMVYDIAQAVGNYEKVDVLATDSRSAAFNIEGVSYLARSFGLFFKSIFHLTSPLCVISLIIKYHMSIGSIVRLFYYWLMTGYVDYIVKKGNYEIVHIHGCAYCDDLWMRICEKNKVKYVITLHGLNSFSDTVRLEPAGKQYERDLLKRVTCEKLPITVISSGMKRLIEDTYGVKDCNNIKVVCNSFSFKKEKKDTLIIRELYGLPESSKILVCVGNICVRKNQGQIIRAFNYLKKELAEQTYVLFLGGQLQPDYSLDVLAEHSIWKSHFISCGIVPKDQVSNYYEQCDAVVLLSLSEGFGLSLIEGMYFGKPSLSFTDVDAYEDIYHPEAMVGIKDHNDEAVAIGIERLLTTNWDKEQIKEYSQKFSSEKMAKNYIRVYRNE